MTHSHGNFKQCLTRKPIVLHSLLYLHRDIAQALDILMEWHWHSFAPHIPQYIFENKIREGTSELTDELW